MLSQFLLRATYGAKGGRMANRIAVSLRKGQIAYSIDVREGGGNLGDKENVKINL